MFSLRVEMHKAAYKCKREKKKTWNQQMQENHWQETQKVQRERNEEKYTKMQKD